MSESTPEAVSSTSADDEALLALYGASARISRVGSFTLIHLDQPSEEEIARRVAEFDPDEFFVDSCPLCEIARNEGGHIVFDRRDVIDRTAAGYDARPDR